VISSNEARVLFSLAKTHLDRLLELTEAFVTKF